MYYQFPTYIDDKGMIPILLDHDWMCMTNGTWTNCPYPCLLYTSDAADE